MYGQRVLSLLFDRFKPISSSNENISLIVTVTLLLCRYPANFTTMFYDCWRKLNLKWLSLCSVHGSVMVCTSGELPLPLYRLVLHRWTLDLSVGTCLPAGLREPPHWVGAIIPLVRTSLSPLVWAERIHIIHLNEVERRLSMST